jgi:hypothetical protein
MSVIFNVQLGLCFRLRPIIESVVFCGQQEIALRGHRDYGSILESNVDNNDGNFRALLRFRLQAGDSVLHQHLSTAGANATYTSWRTQNSIISACGSIIAKRISDSVNISKFFTVIADETTDCSTKSQFSISVRYVDCQKFLINEHFLSFVEMEECSAESLSKTILSILSKHCLNAENLRGRAMMAAAPCRGNTKECSHAYLKNTIRQFTCIVLTMS